MSRKKPQTPATLKSKDREIPYTPGDTWAQGMYEKQQRHEHQRDWVIIAFVFVVVMLCIFMHVSWLGGLISSLTTGALKWLLK